VDEPHGTGHSQLGGPFLGRRDERRAEVHAGAADPVVAGPGAEHLAAAAGQVEHGGAGGQPECDPEDRQLARIDRVVDAVVALAFDEVSGEVHGSRQSCPSNRLPELI
jgi:hypothetical protein